jgi:hypothetical protein
MDAKPVPLSGADAAQIAVPAERRALGESQPRLATVIVEQAQFDAFRHLGKD